MHLTSGVSGVYDDFLEAEMEPGHWVSNFDRVGSGHGSVCQIGV